MTEAGLIAARFVHYAALVVTFGAFAYLGNGERSASLAGRLARLGLASSIVLLLSALAVLAAITAGLGGGFAALSDATLWAAVLGETNFGRVWSVRLAMAVLLIAISLAAWRLPTRALTSFGILLAGGLVVTVALTGHAAAAEGAPGVLHRVADAAHLIAAAVWLGALPPLLILLRPESTETPTDLEIAVARLQAFHAIGLSSVVVLVVSGLVNSWYLVGTFDRLLTTTYGGVLLAKVVVVLAMIGLAAENRWRLVPALARDVSCSGRADASKLRSRIRAELVLGIFVLVAVSVLGAIAPAAD